MVIELLDDLSARGDIRLAEFASTPPLIRAAVLSPAADLPLVSIPKLQKLAGGGKAAGAPLGIQRGGTAAS